MSAGRMALAALTAYLLIFPAVPALAACQSVAPFFVYGACRLGEPVAAAPSPAGGSGHPLATAGNWRKIARRASGALYVETVSAIDRAGDSARLAIRCLDDNTSVILHFPGQEMGNRGPQREIVYRRDGAAPAILELERGKDRAMLGAWQGYRAVPFIRELLGASSLEVSAISAKGTELHAQFAVAGLDEAIGELRAACHW